MQTVIVTAHLLVGVDANSDGMAKFQAGAKMVPIIERFKEEGITVDLVSAKVAKNGMTAEGLGDDEAAEARAGVSVDVSDDEVLV